jgi:hypothetical protein
LNGIHRWAVIVAGAASLSLASIARADGPTLDYLLPAGGQRGKTVEVTAGGKFPNWPAKVWADSPAIHVSAGKATGALSVQIDAGASIGPHLLRLYSEDGASALKSFVVGEGPEMMEVEPNDEPGTAQEIKQLPVTINGELSKPGDVDCYAVELKAGATLVASVQGRRLGSLIDPMLHVIDSDGIEVAFAHDGLGLDPLLAFHADRAGKYVVRVSAFAYPPAADVKLAGAKGDVYRLTLTTGPATRFCLPSGVRRGEKGTVKVLGWNLPEAGMELSGNASEISGEKKYLSVAAPGADGWMRVEVGEAPEWVDERACAEGVVAPVPVNISGVIGTPGDQRRFRIHTNKGEAIHLRVRAAAINSSMDTVVGIEDARGKVLAGANGSAGPTGVADPSLDWVAPVEADYFVTLRDLYHKGGPGYFYRVEIGHPRPAVEATVDAHAYTVAAGTSAQVKMKVTRQGGHNLELVAVATGLPAGVTATSAAVPPGGGEVTLTISAAKDAKPSGGMVRFMVVGTNPDKPEAHTAVFPLGKEKDSQELVEQTGDIWLTVTSLPSGKPTR